MFYNVLLGAVMLFGRFGTMIPVLAIAGSVVEKKAVPVSAGTFPTNGGLFVILLAAVVLIVGALTFFASWSLGPIVEHLAMMAGKLY
jgi:K+-transporting ATPase ATPase A chain